MFQLPLLLVALHVLSDVIWVGGLISVLFLARTAPDAAEQPQRERAALALELHKRVASPARWAALGFGLWRFVQTPSYYAHSPWMHAKLTFALLLFGLHDVAGAKLRKFSAGKAASGAPSWMLGAVLTLATAIVVLAVLKSALL